MNSYLIIPLKRRLSETGRSNRRPDALGTAGGFSLIELLVVIAIIGLLVTMVTPGLNSARQAAIRTACTSNLRQVGHATGLYISDNRGRYPPAWPISGPYSSQFPQNVLYHYVNGNAKIFHDPAMRNERVTTFDSNGDGTRDARQYMSYGVNPRMSIQTPYPDGSSNFMDRISASMIRAMNQAIYFGCSSRLVGDSRDATAISDWRLYGPAWGSWSNPTVLSDRHNGSGNILFADLHVGAHPYEEQFPGGRIFDGWWTR